MQTQTKCHFGMCVHHPVCALFYDLIRLNNKQLHNFQREYTSNEYFFFIYIIYKLAVPNIEPPSTVMVAPFVY